VVYWSEGRFVGLVAFFGLMGQMPHWGILGH
jgi:hypothetical protein